MGSTMGGFPASGSQRALVIAGGARLPIGFGMAQEQKSFHGTQPFRWAAVMPNIVGSGQGGHSDLGFAPCHGHEETNGD